MFPSRFRMMAIIKSGIERPEPPSTSVVRKLAPKAKRKNPSRITRRIQDLPKASDLSERKPLARLVPPNSSPLRETFLGPSSSGPPPIQSPLVSTDHAGEGHSEPETVAAAKIKKTRVRKKALIESDLTRFDRFVTVGVPPSQNPSMYDRKIAKFILDSRLRFPDAMLLTCVGSFYEAYFDQAIELAEILNIKQAKNQFAGQSYPFSGFPTASLHKHLKTLVNDHNRVVAIAEQIPGTEDYFERKIVQIITPGTITDEELIDTDAHNYLLAIDGTQLAWLDVSTGSYFQATCEGGESDLIDHICRIAPKEILVSEHSSFSVPSHSKAAKLSMLITRMKTPEKSLVGCPTLSSAQALITRYTEQNLLPPQSSLDPFYINFSRHLKLDAEAIDGLEILSSQNGKRIAGSLISTVSRTITKPGKRLLRDRLMTPSAILSEIESRLDLVQGLVTDRFLREDLQDRLCALKDIDYIRLLQRFNLAQGTVTDLISLVKVLETIRFIYPGLGTSAILAPLGCHQVLKEHISDVLSASLFMRDSSTETDNELEDLEIDEEKDLFRPSSWNVRPDHSKLLTSLHKKLDAALESGRLLQNEYRTRFQSKDLKLKTASKIGAVLSIVKGRGRKPAWKDALEEMKGQKVVENGSRVLVITAEWTALHATITNLKDEIGDAEHDVLRGLFEEVKSSHASLKASFKWLSELDVVQSFATFAAETGCVRPSLHLKKSTVVDNGRHPIAEQALISSAHGAFQPNSIVMKEDDGLCQIITGPNNGGKSTFLRQVAIAHVLAQAGGFVPADQAELGLVTQIFTRFGSHDNMVLGKGTFLVEMEETAKILRGANAMSLVVMDEVGRGTGNEDGLSIAYGVVKYLLERVKCRTLFATHLHHLGPLLADKDDYLRRERLGFFCIGSSQTEDEGASVLYFPHRVVRGLNPNSGGIDVGRIAGLPKEVIESAQQVKKDILGFDSLLDKSLVRDLRDVKNFGS